MSAQPGEAGSDGGDGGERKGAPARRGDPLVGTVINGKFHIKKAIARGGMGRIYYGTQAPLDRPVALKIVKADSINEEESQFLKRFLLEASILAKLQHPNVVTLFDYGRIDHAKVEMYFIAMEYLDGQTLGERLREQGAMATYEALILFRQIARGLREAHSRGVIHRDLKPSNIMLMPEADGGEIVKLVDFGIGKVDGEAEAEELTRDGVLVGTPKYMAPEQFNGHSSPASDVFALGTIIYQCLAGSLPFTGNTLAECMIAKLQHPVPPIRTINPICDVTENVERLLYAMLAKTPEERPTLDEVFGQLAVCEDEIFGGSGPRLGMSGSRPGLGFPNSSRPLSLGALRVPYTVVHKTQSGEVAGFHPEGTTKLTPRPSLGPSTFSPNPSGGVDAMGAPLTASTGAHVFSTGSGPMLTGMTPRPMATSAFPSSNAPVKKSSGPIAAILVALVFAIGSVTLAGVWIAKSKLGTTTAGAAPSTAPAASSANVTVAKEFTLHLDSNPSGAIVLEDGKTLGATPIDLRMDRQGPARSFQIKKEGFVSTVFAQGPSEVDVETSVPLAPDGARTVKSHGTGKTPPTGPTKTVTTANPPQGDPDIRLKR